MKFVRINDQLMNLSNITTIEMKKFDGVPCIEFSFVGQEWPVRVMKDTMGAYEEIKAWIESCPALIRTTEFYPFVNTASTGDY